MNNDIISSTIANIFTASEIGIGEFHLAQIADYLSLSGGGWDLLKLVMAGQTLIIVVFLVIVTTKLNRLTASKPDLAKIIAPPSSATSGVNARWEEVLKHITSTREAEWKFAVIEADKLVEEQLKGAGFQGETMGDRLMNIQPGQLTTIQSLWEAHKIRNRLVHDINYFLRYTEAKRAVSLYEKTLRELQAL